MARLERALPRCDTADLGVVSSPRVSTGPAGCRISRDYARRRGWASKTGHPSCRHHATFSTQIQNLFQLFFGFKFQLFSCEVGAATRSSCWTQQSQEHTSTRRRRTPRHRSWRLLAALGTHRASRALLEELPEHDSHDSHDSPLLARRLRPLRRRSLPLGQGEAAEGEEASATEGVEAADATMPDGTPLTAEYSFQEVFAEYRTRNETFLESLEVELRSLPPARHCDTEGAFLA